MEMSMEKELFDWKDWDGDPESMTFYNVILKRQIGDFPVGTKFSSATILFTKGILQLWDYDSLANEFSLHYQVGEWKRKTLMRTTI